jgi:hypothetical protein
MSAKGLIVREPWPLGQVKPASPSEWGSFQTLNIIFDPLP